MGALQKNVYMKELEQFKRYLQIKYKPATVNTYFSIIQHFADFLEEKGKSINTFSPADVYEFIEYCKNIKFYHQNIIIFDENKKPQVLDILKWEDKRSKELSQAFIENVKKAILAYVRFKVEQGSRYFTQLMLKHKLGLIDTFKFSSSRIGVKEHIVLSVEEIEKLLKLYKSKPKKQAGLMLLFYFGCRPIELTLSFLDAYKNDKINFDECKIELKNAKLRKDTLLADPKATRLLPFPEVLADKIKLWCEHLDQKRKEMKETALVQIPYQILRNRKDRIMKIIGKRITPKVARYTVTTKLLEVLPQHYVEYFIGHITQGSLRHYVNKEEVCKYLRQELIDNRKHFMIQVFDALH